MKRLRKAKLFAAALGIAGYGCQASPQTVSTIPTVVPPTPTPLAANMLGVSPLASPPGPVTIWQKLGIGKQQREFCLRALCDSPAGALMSRAVSPISRLTGGLIPPLCSPVPTAGELLDPGVIGANSKAKLDKLNAEKRKKAVEELANLDCHYWPEAEDALIGALRADRNECVRHTAALALNRGCCCTKKTIEALTICVTGSEADGHPCEKSARVRAAAAIALENCLQRACCPECPIPEGAVPVEEKRDLEEKPKSKEETPRGSPSDDAGQPVAWVKPGPAMPDVDPDEAARKKAKAYYNSIKSKSMQEVLERARHGLATMPPLPLDLAVPPGHPDYEAAGVRTFAANPSNYRANLYDMLTGRVAADTQTYNHTPILATSLGTTGTGTAGMVATGTGAAGSGATGVVVQNTVEPPVTRLEAKTSVPKTAEIKPAQAQPSAAVAVPTPMPTTRDTVVVSPLALPVKTPAKADVATASGLQSDGSSQVQMQSPAKADVATPAHHKTAAPAGAAASKPAAAPLATKPAETPAPRLLPTAAASNANRVLKMLDEPCDLAALRHAIESLTPAELKEQPKLMPALLKAAEFPSDTGLRVACLKAVQRGKMKVQEARPALERISRDRDAIVATEAARTLQELRTGH